MISLLSTDAFSTAHTSRILVPVLHWIFPRASAETLDLMHVVIRKAAHLTEYFILGILLNRSLRGNPGWNPKWAVWAIVIVACYASLDEFHQSFVPSRTASPWDALLDTVGASAAQVVLWVWHSSRARGGETKAISRANSDTKDI